MLRANANRCRTVFFGLFATKDVHLWRSDEPSHKLVARLVIQLKRAANLLDMTCTQNHNLVGHGHRFDLVVSHVDHCGLKTLVQFADFQTHADTQRSIKV